MGAATDNASAYDATPERAIRELTAHAGPLLVDLDETLYLGNSTEDFIDLAEPGLIAMVLLRALDALRLWRWTGGAATRDVWRVGLIWRLFPWTRTRWRAQVGELARRLANRPLVEALQRSPGEIVILTAGFRPIVEPLVTALGFPGARIIAPRLGSFADRSNGKLHAAVNALGQQSVRASLVVTDSLDDLALLAQCARPLRTIWPGARFRRALSRIYLPGEYITHVKRPGEQYILRVILQEDFVFWVLATVFLAAHPWLHVAGLGCLLISFWAIYERGYVDNDWAAAHLEHDGKLSASFWQCPVATPAVQPWIWAAALGAAAVCLLKWPQPTPNDFAKWLLVLVSVYATFKLYNRLDKGTRVWLFAALQLARAAALLALVPTTTLGAAGLAALALGKWVPYHMYRAGSGWPDVQPNLIRLLFFVVMAAVLGAAEGRLVLLSLTAAAMLAWNLFRARSELVPSLLRMHFITRKQRDRQDPRAAS